MKFIPRTSAAIFSFVAAAFLCACGTSAPPETKTASSPEQQDPNWVNEEILLQLKELRKEVAELNSVNKDIQELRAAVTRLEEKSGNARAAAPSVPPELVPAEVKLAGAPVLGKASATIAIAEFSDFQCPFCARHYQQTFPEIKKAFIDTGKVKYVAKAYPLGFHDQAKGAAIAALCADRAGSYWPMHDALFRNSQRLGNGLYVSEANTLKLDQGKFSSCLGASASAAVVDADVAYGSSLGVSGTPKFFIGRVVDNKLVDVTVINGAQPYAVFAAAIEKKLKKGG